MQNTECYDTGHRGVKIAHLDNHLSRVVGVISAPCLKGGLNDLGLRYDCIDIMDITIHIGIILGWEEGK